MAFFGALEPSFHLPTRKYEYLKSLKKFNHAQQQKSGGLGVPFLQISMDFNLEDTLILSF